MLLHELCVQPDIRLFPFPLLPGKIFLGEQMNMGVNLFAHFQSIPFFLSQNERERSLPKLGNIVYYTLLNIPRNRFKVQGGAGGVALSVCPGSKCGGGAASDVPPSQTVIGKQHQSQFAGFQIPDGYRCSFL